MLERRKQHNKKISSEKLNFLFGCTINDKKEMECLIKKGINGMQTDYPRRLTNLAKQYGLKENEEVCLVTLNEAKSLDLIQ